VQTGLNALPHVAPHDFISLARELAAHALGVLNEGVIALEAGVEADVLLLSALDAQLLALQDRVALLLLLLLRHVLQNGPQPSISTNKWKNLHRKRRVPGSGLMLLFVSVVVELWQAW
jgi:hypothetical protein